MGYTVPVIVDDVKLTDNLNLARCTYFSIECDTPSTDWTLTLREHSVPFLMLGLSGIITAPVEGDIFRNANDIDLLVEAIEKQQGMFFDTNTIWLPAFLLGKPRRGVVYRIDAKLFGLALEYVMHRVSEKKFFDMCEKLEKTATLSEPETYAFKEWESSHIDKAKKLYETDAQFNLKYRRR